MNRVNKNTVIRKRRGNSRYVMLFIFLGVLLIALALTSYSFAKKMDFFNITKIEVVGNKNLDTEFLREIAKEYVGVNLFTLPEQHIKYKYSKIVRIKKIKLRRIIPKKLKLIFEERVGYLYLKTVEGQIIPIDKECVVLDYGNFLQQEDLPVVDTKLSVTNLTTGEVVADESVRKIMEVHKLVTASKLNEKLFSEYFIKNKDVYFVESKTGSIVCLGKKDFPAAIQKLEFYWDNLGILQYTEVDLKYTDRIIIKNKEEK